MKQIILSILGFIFCLSSSAQLIMKPIAKSISFDKKNQARAILASVIADTVTLPFWDDFSYNGQNPDSIFWLIGNDVLINSGEGINPPTLNVASFDGINASGGAHSSSEFVEPADSLISQPINLSIVPEIKRSTVFLSFHWQMQGRGELPDERDSIRLQFLTEDSEWITQWVMTGGTENSSDSFQKKYVAITNPIYYHSGFQFKFQNFGKTDGPFDTWHLDYIYLNQDRVSTNESIFDLAIATEPPSLFNTYSNIPYDQLFAFPDTIFAPYVVGIASQENNPQPVGYTFIVTDTIANQTILSETTNSAPLPALDRSEVTTNAIDRSLLNQNTDSLILNTQFHFQTGDNYLIQSINNGGADTTFLISDTLNYRINDMLERNYVIHETLSYDDGTADFAAGINQTNGQIAVEYTIAVEDTLTAMDLYFPRVGEKSVGQTIHLSVIKGDLQNGEITQLYRKEGELVKIDTAVNQFVRYELTRPILVSGTFYLVFEQTRDEFIGIGLDKNNPQPNKIYSNTDGDWIQNGAAAVNGSLMFRAIFGDTDGVITGINSDEFESISIYPNPANEKLMVKGNFNQLELFTIAGEKIIVDMNQNEINTSGLKNGVYILKAESNSGFSTHKVIINH